MLDNSAGLRIIPKPPLPIGLFLELIDGMDGKPFQVLFDANVLINFLSIFCFFVFGLSAKPVDFGTVGDGCAVDAPAIAMIRVRADR